jgi:hypothetical protein
MFGWYIKTDAVIFTEYASFRLVWVSPALPQTLSARHISNQ